MIEITDAHNDALQKAKVALMARPDSAFFTTLLFSLQIMWAEITPWGEPVPTAGVTSTHLYINPTWFLGLTPPARVGLLVHECCHPAYLHGPRMGERDPKDWNDAGDHVINLGLLERNFELPAHGLWDPQYKGMATEEVYDRIQQAKLNCPLPSPMTMQGAGTNQGPGSGRSSPNNSMGGDLLTDPNITPEQAQRNIEDSLVRAAIQSKISGDAPGTIPGDIQLLIDQLLNPILPWYRILQKFMSEVIKDDYSWRRPNRKYMPDHYLPSVMGEGLVNFAAAADISGSVSDDDFKRMISETGAVLKQFMPKEVTFLQFDTQIISIDKVKNIKELLAIEFHGRGGTDIAEVIEWANKHRPQFLLMFTDGEFNWPKVTTRVPVIWLIHNNPRFTAPYGKVIHYEPHNPKGGVVIKK